jgi:hypothetical protein
MKELNLTKTTLARLKTTVLTLPVRDYKQPLFHQACLALAVIPLLLCRHLAVKSVNNTNLSKLTPLKK